MSIPHVCPGCGHHITTAHAPDCCYDTHEYAHLGWPSYQVGAAMPDTTGGNITVSDAHWGKLQDSATAIRRLLEYLEEEPEIPCKDEPAYGPGVKNPYEEARLVLAKHATKLRKEADGISLPESRAKRLFAANVLDGIIEEMQQ